jgi:hypothetical protein
MRTLVTTRDTYYETCHPAPTACPPSLLGDGDKLIETAYGEEKIFCIEPSRDAMAGQKYLVPARQAERNKHMDGPLLFVLFESPYSKQGPPLSSLSGYHALSCSGVLR